MRPVYVPFQYPPAFVVWAALPLSQSHCCKYKFSSILFYFIYKLRSLVNIITILHLFDMCKPLILYANIRLSWLNISREEKNEVLRCLKINHLIYIYNIWTLWKYLITIIIRNIMYRAISIKFRIHNFLCIVFMNQQFERPYNIHHIQDLPLQFQILNQ